MANDRRSSPFTSRNGRSSFYRLQSRTTISMKGLGISVILCACCCLPCCYAERTPLEMARQCEHILMDKDVEPRETRANDSLRVVVPWKTGYTEFVNFKPETCVIDGFSVQVFLQAVFRMEQTSSPLRYQFVVHGTGTETRPYNEMVGMLTRKEVDMVVGDLTITKERLENVSFTVPYMATQLAMVTPYSYGSAGTVWDFSKPFSRNLWITLLMSLLVTGAALYFLEDKNPDFFAASKVHDSDSNHACASMRPTSLKDGVRHQEPTSSGFSFGAPHGNLQPSSSSSDPPQDNPPPFPSKSDGPHINPQSLQSSFHTSDSVVNVNASPISRNKPVLKVNKANSSDNNHIRYNDILLQQPVGVPIYDETSRIRRFTNAYWFTAMCALQSQQESVRTHLGRIVTVMWLLLMIIFNSSYTASLATLLSAQQRFPTIENFELLRKNTSIPIGYQQGSFLVDYLNNTQLKGHEFRGFASTEEIEQAFRKGPQSPEGIGAVLDELAFLPLLLASNCDLTIASSGDDILPAFGGFAFAFQKGDALIDKMSMIILELLADGTVQRLQNAWKLGSNASNKCESNNSVHVLTLKSFGGLFGILAVVYLICLACRALTKTILRR